MNTDLTSITYPPHAAPPLINNPAKQRGSHRFISLGLTFVIWMLWLYLWSPVLALASVTLGFSPASASSPQHPDTTNVPVVFWVLIACLLLALVCVVCVSKFRRPNFMRKHPHWISHGDMNNPDGLDSESVRHLSFASQAKIYFNIIGKPVKVLISGNPAKGPLKSQKRGLAFGKTLSCE